MNTSPVVAGRRTPLTASQMHAHHLVGVLELHWLHWWIFGGVRKRASLCRRSRDEHCCSNLMSTQVSVSSFESCWTGWDLPSGQVGAGAVQSQASTAFGGAEHVDTPVPRRGGSGSRGPQCLHPRQGSAAFDAEQIVDIPAGGGPQLPDPGASASSAFSPDELD